MKKLSISTVFFLFMGIVLFNSCRKDVSTLDVNNIPGITFDTTGQGSLSVFQFDTLKITPVLSMPGVNETNLKYEWRINIMPRVAEYLTIGTSKNLDYEIELKPTAADEHYQILYIITDTTNGLKYTMSWPLNVRNSIGEGLVIAETSDGYNTDISHIMSPLVTTDYNKENVRHHIFSSLNGGLTIPGIIKQMRATTLRGVGQVILGITDNSIVSIKTLDYSLTGMNEDLFYAPVTDMKPQFIGGIIQGDIYVGNGKLTGVWLGISNKFGLPFDSKYTVPDHVALNGNNDYPAVVISFYDEVNGYFVYQSSIQSFGDTKMHQVPSASSSAFDPANLPGKINIAASVNQSGDFLHLLKDKISKKLSLYVLSGGQYDDDYNLIPPAPKAVYDLSNAPDIDNATTFVLLDDQKVLYYATKTKIYAMLYGTSTPTFADRYSVQAGEEITTLQVYRQADYPSRIDGYDEPYISTNNKQLIMSTYNGSEGKLYILPMINIGVGNIDVQNIKTFKGFDRITAVTSQL